jgi:hypothetical protein
VHFAGNTRPFIRHRHTCLLDIKSIERLVFIQGFFDLCCGSDAGFDEFPHEFSTCPADDGDAHLVEILERLPDLRVP